MNTLDKITLYTDNLKQMITENALELQGEIAKINQRLDSNNKKMEDLINQALRAHNEMCKERSSLLENRSTYQAASHSTNLSTIQPSEEIIEPEITPNQPGPSLLIAEHPEHHEEAGEKPKNGNPPGYISEEDPQCKKPERFFSPNHEILWELNRIVSDTHD